jgi:hypothetical protein
MNLTLLDRRMSDRVVVGSVILRGPELKRWRYWGSPGVLYRVIPKRDGNWGGPSPSDGRGGVVCAVSPQTRSRQFLLGNRILQT